MTDTIDLSLPALPTKPRLRPGVTWEPMGDTVVVQGIDRPHYFRGRHAGRLLVPLLTALTGRAGHDELAAATACSVEVVRQALRKLDALGVLEDLEGDEDVADTPLSDWYARATAETGLHSSGRSVVRFLRTQTVRLLGTGRLHARISELLTEHGLTVSTGSIDSNGTCAQGTLTVVVAPDDDCLHQLSTLDDAMAAAGARWLLVTEGPGEVRLGPLFDRALFPCLCCSRRALPEGLTPATGPAPDGAPIQLELELEIRTDLHATSVAAECLALIAGVGHPSTLRRIIRLGDVEDGFTARSVSPVADCVLCVPDGHASASPDTSAVVYEYGVAGLPENLHGSRAQYGHYAAANLLAQVPGRLCLDETALWSTDLQEPDVLGGGPWSRLSRLLTEVYGLRPGTLRRHPPTGGNLGSPRALVWLPECTWGTERAGLHSYEPQIDALCRLEVQPGFQERLRALAGDTTCVLQLVDIETLENKYGARAPRIGWLDAGVTFEHLAMVCEGLAITAHLSTPERASDFFDAVLPLSRQLLLSGLIELADIHVEGK
ncbi:hypothetical protein [Streptomyces sp. NPDC060035]|uniref:hypothetical protein n=1 Tax=Streptomyces sp. NPDC060035 TaxID=3347044 RepID=UPI003687A417